MHTQHLSTDLLIDAASTGEWSHRTPRQSWRAVAGCGVWQRHGLLTKHERLLRLEKATAEGLPKPVKTTGKETPQKAAA